MSRSALRQKDTERLIKAAENQGAIVQIDLKTLVATVIPGFHRVKAIDVPLPPPGILLPGNHARRGKENWDED